MEGVSSTHEGGFGGPTHEILGANGAFSCILSLFLACFFLNGFTDISLYNSFPFVRYAFQRDPVVASSQPFVSPSIGVHCRLSTFLLYFDHFIQICVRKLTLAVSVNLVHFEFLVSIHSRDENDTRKIQLFPQLAQRSHRRCSREWERVKIQKL